MEDVEDDPAQGSEVLCGVADVLLVVILPEGFVQWFLMLQWLLMAC